MDSGKFCAYQKYILSLITSDLENNPNFPPHVKEATQYALSQGKRLRPSIVLAIAENQKSADRLALFIEYIHNASLIVDDLPCMDNDQTRRGYPTVHVQYGEYMAQLLAFNLMVAALHHSSVALEELSQSRNSNQVVTQILGEEINKSLSFQGITGGQYLDLTIKKDIDLLSPRQQRERILELVRLKTGCLFGLSFQLGWYARAHISAETLRQDLEDMKKAGVSFGICYQIIDDLSDRDRDLQQSGGYNNICRYYSHNDLVDLFSEHLSIFQQICWKQGVLVPLLQELYQFLLQSFRKEMTV